MDGWNNASKSDVGISVMIAAVNASSVEGSRKFVMTRWTCPNLEAVARKRPIVDANNVLAATDDCKMEVVAVAAAAAEVVVVAAEDF